MLIYGPSGAGKKTRIRAVLRELFGSNVDKLRMENHQFETPSKRKIEVRTVASNYHIEVNPSDVVVPIIVLEGLDFDLLLGMS